MISTNRSLSSGITVPQIIDSLWSAAGIKTGSTAVGSGVWPSANLALYIPLPKIWETVTIKRILVAIGSTAAANLDVGIYDESGNRLVSSGSVALAGTSQTQAVDIADTQLAPGRYYVGIALDTNTDALIRLATGFSTGVNRMLGVKEEAAAFPLPATATFAESGTRDYIPWIAVTLEP